MLAACSAHFSKLFSNSTLNGQLIVILEGTHHQDLQILLQFMYKGVAYLHQDRIESVLRTAEVLQVCSLVSVEREVKCDLITNLHSAIRQNSIRVYIHFYDLAEYSKKSMTASYRHGWSFFKLWRQGRH